MVYSLDYPLLITKRQTGALFTLGYISLLYSTSHATNKSSICSHSTIQMLHSVKINQVNQVMKAAMVNQPKRRAKRIRDCWPGVCASQLALSCISQKKKAAGKATPIGYVPHGGAKRLERRAYSWWKSSWYTNGLPENPTPLIIANQNGAIVISPEANKRC